MRNLYISLYRVEDKINYMGTSYTWLKIIKYIFILLIYSQNLFNLSVL